jgi:hypothetical protein
MKSILYVGVTLMIGACIYGFVDYKKTSRKKEFTRMYESPEVKEQVITVEKNIPVAEETSQVVTTTKKTPLKEEPAAMKSKVVIAAAEKIESVSVVVNTASLKETGSAEKFKQARKKKLNYKLFSRAPLREYKEETIKLPEPGKIETTKTEVKEQ